MGIRQISIERFRGLRAFRWEPKRGINCILGPGDVGKSTVLSALAMALTPRPSVTLSEYDYFQRRTVDGFSIQVVVDAEPDLTSRMRVQLQRGWKTGALVDLLDDAGASSQSIWVS